MANSMLMIFVEL